MFQPAQTVPSGFIDGVFVDGGRIVSRAMRTPRWSVTRWLTAMREPSTKEVLRRLDPHLLADIGVAPEALARD